MNTPETRYTALVLALPAAVEYAERKAKEARAIALLRLSRDGIEITAALGRGYRASNVVTYLELREARFPFECLRSKIEKTIKEAISCNPIL